MRLACPGPWQALGLQWGAAALEDVWETFHLTEPPTLSIAIEVAPPPPPPVDAMLAAIGQENLTLSPIQIALAYATLINNGHLPAVQFVEAVETASGGWAAPATVDGITPDGSTPAETQAAMTAAATRELWQQLANEGAFAEHAVRVLAGPRGSTNSWYAGLVDNGPTGYVVILVLEEETDLEHVEQIGRRVLRRLES
jgi:cell division protein FtsI/penicillin-binding protein 2